MASCEKTGSRARRVKGTAGDTASGGAIWKIDLNLELRGAAGGRRAAAGRVPVTYTKNILTVFLGSRYI